MNIIRKKSALIMSLAISSAVLLSACGTSAQAPGGGTGGQGTVSGIITVSGSTSVQPLVQDLADIFNETEPGVSIEIQGGGSSQGIKDVSQGISDMGNSSRDLTDEEKKLGITEHIIAYDGIAVVTHPSNPVTDLTMDQIKDIFKGEINNWKEVGGPDREILVVTREEGSGTRTAFEEMLKLQVKKNGYTVSHIISNALVADGNGSIKANIAAKDNAIGYTSLGYVDNTMKKISIDGIECMAESIKNKTYPVSRQFLILTKGEVRPEVKAFLDFILGDAGQEVVSKTYIAIR